MENNSLNNIIKVLKMGGVGVLPTDTIYGLVGSALSKKVVDKIYKIKQRKTSSPLIVLISSIKDLKKFGIKINKKQKVVLEKYWPGKVSIILPCTSSKFNYLHRGTKTLAVRFPAKKSLLKILKKAGPLVAPSANPEGLKPSENILQAKTYFSPVRNPEGSQGDFVSNGVGSSVDFYLAGGTLKSKPSTLIKIDKQGDIAVLRGIIKNYDQRKQK